jgi:glucose/arabinose dehydrogenase
MLDRSTAFASVAALAVAIGNAPLRAQDSTAGLRFHGTGTGYQDRVGIPIDDDAPGADASAPCDVGAASFTIDFWLRGTLADNPSANAGGDVLLSADAWITGHTIVDRDIWGPSARDFGISIAGGHVRFGVGAGDFGGGSGGTIEGDTPVLDGTWHHVACVRDASSGRIAVYVDGRLDMASPAGLSTNDLSYPNAGVPGAVTPWGPFLVLGAEKHDAGAAYPSFAGDFDELRVWARALGNSELLDVFDRVVAPNTNGLVGMWRFEEGAGTVCFDSSAAGSPAGFLIAGVAGNGEWVLASNDPGGVAPVSSGALPAGFQRTLVTDDLLQPTALEALPDGRLLVGEKHGHVRVVENGVLLATPLVDIAVDTFGGERGLLGLAAHPNFATNGWLYAYVTTPAGFNQVVRHTVVGNTASPASAVVVWQNPAPASVYHHGGQIAFGPDGHLYIATGDQFDSATSHDLATQHGKILRVAADGSIPPGNPFVGVPGAQAPIWARGLRNPFRFTFDDATGALWIGDVGGNADDAWEEIDRGLAGANYGWPDQEGPNCVSGSCSGVTFPVWSYRHDDPTFAPGAAQGSLTLGPVYRATAFPSQYQGNLFVGDYANRWIRRVVFDASGAVVGAPLFAREPQGGSIVDLAVGADGALYTLSFGIAWSGANDGPGLWRIAYGGAGNQAPIALAGATPTSGLPPLAVQFTSSASSDPDAGPSALTRTWDFGDGQSSNAVDPVHVYAAAGQYTARVTLSDGAATVQSAPIAIEVGNAPTARIRTSADGTRYRAGETVQFDGVARDVEDGLLPPSAFTWRVVLVHAAHVHPFAGPITGVTSASFVVPSSGHLPHDTHFEVQLEVVDSDGLVATVTKALEPDVSTIAFDSRPSGLAITVDGETETTPFVVESLVGFQHAIEAPLDAQSGGVAFAFTCWTSGASAAHRLVAPPGGMNLWASYERAASAQVDVAVPAANRNADHWPSSGVQSGNAFDALALCFGRDGTGAYQTALAFPLAVPAGATIVDAVVEFTATADQVGAPSVAIAAFDTGAIAPFPIGSSAPLTAFAPLTPSLVWSPPAFAPGSVQRTPNLAALVQAVVDRGDFAAGNHVGFVFDGAGSTADAWRCVRNFASGDPPRLYVEYSLPAGGGGCANACGFASYGLWSGRANVLGLVGLGEPRLGATIELRTTALPRGSAGALTLFSRAADRALRTEAVLLVDVDALTGAVFTPAIGTSVSTFATLPTGASYVGARLFVQSLAADPSAPGEVLASGGLEVVICP